MPIYHDIRRLAFALLLHYTNVMLCIDLLPLTSKLYRTWVEEDVKNIASSKDGVFELFSEDARHVFLIFPTVSVSIKQLTHKYSMYLHI